MTECAAHASVTGVFSFIDLRRARVALIAMIRNRRKSGLNRLHRKVWPRRRLQIGASRRLEIEIGQKNT